MAVTVKEVMTCPVLDAGGGVAGVVSEADLLRTEEFRGGRHQGR